MVIVHADKDRFRNFFAINESAKFNCGRMSRDILGSPFETEIGKDVGCAR